MTVNDIYNIINKLAPFSLQEEWDNAGLLVGNDANNVTGILMALDVTSDVIDEAINKNCNLILTHHPVIFGSFKSVVRGDVTSDLIFKLIQNDISVISAHTNLDTCLVNDVLISKLGVSNFEKYDQFMRIGFIDTPISMNEYISLIKSRLNNNGVRYYSSGKDVYKIACLGGAGADWIKNAYDSGCDTFITSDVKHHQWLEAKHLGINLIDADHFNTENCVISVLYNLLKESCDDISIYIADNNVQVVCYG